MRNHLYSFPRAAVVFSLSGLSHGNCVIQLDLCRTTLSLLFGLVFLLKAASLQKVARQRIPLCSSVPVATYLLTREEQGAQRQNTKLFM